MQLAVIWLKVEYFDTNFQKNYRDSTIALGLTNASPFEYWIMLAPIIIIIIIIYNYMYFSYQCHWDNIFLCLFTEFLTWILTKQGNLANNIQGVKILIRNSCLLLFVL